jgi:anthranilate synthase component 1
MLAQSVIIFDHIYQTIKIVSHVHIPDGTPPSNITSLYDEAVGRIEALRQKLISPEIVFPKQGPITLGEKAESNVGKAGYEGFVTKLKEHIVKGDIIQAVPSQRLARKSGLHPFNIYRHLRRLNPSPYMFYLDCGDVQIVGASPETLCKVEKRKVYNHAIAGTVKRGKTAEGTSIYFINVRTDEIRGRSTRCRVVCIRQGQSGTYHVGRPCQERRQQGLQARNRKPRRLDASREIQSRHPLDKSS